MLFLFSVIYIMLQYSVGCTYQKWQKFQIMRYTYVKVIPVSETHNCQTAVKPIGVFVNLFPTDFSSLRQADINS